MASSNDEMNLKTSKADLHNSQFVVELSEKTVRNRDDLNVHVVLRVFERTLTDSSRRGPGLKFLVQIIDCIGSVFWIASRR